MKAVFDRHALLEALQSASLIIPKRTPKAVLQNVKLTADQKTATLKATDLESAGLTLEIRGYQAQEPGEILLPADRTSQILRECPSDEVRIEGDEDGVTITSQFSEFNLPGENPDQYPAVPGFDADKWHSIPSGQLAEMIKRTLFTVATESARYALTGVLWELQESQIRLVATDGKGLAMVDGTATAHQGHATTGTPVVPTRVMQLLARSLPDQDEPVFVSFRPNDVLFKTGRVQIYGRLVEGRYPTYRDVFPKKTSHSIPLLVGPLTAVTRQAAILTDDETRGVEYLFHKGTLTLLSRVADKGKSKVTLPIAFDGKKTVVFDPDRLLAYLRVLPPDMEITLELVENNTVTLFTAPGKFSFILVPLTRREES